MENPNKYRVNLILEKGCDFNEGEYGLLIAEILNGVVTEKDIELVKELVENTFTAETLPKEPAVEFDVIESGEWEDVFWHGYYELDSDVYHIWDEGEKPTRVRKLWEIESKSRS